MGGGPFPQKVREGLKAAYQRGRGSQGGPSDPALQAGERGSRPGSRPGFETDPVPAMELRFDSFARLAYDRGIARGIS